jgi:hypothetical protein
MNFHHQHQLSPSTHMLFFAAGVKHIGIGDGRIVELPSLLCATSNTVVLSYRDERTDVDNHCVFVGGRPHTSTLIFIIRCAHSKPFEGIWHGPKRRVSRDSRLGFTIGQATVSW